MDASSAISTVLPITTADPTIDQIVALLPQLVDLLASEKWVAAVSLVLLLAVYVAKFFKLFDRITPRLRLPAIVAASAILAAGAQLIHGTFNVAEFFKAFLASAPLAVFTHRFIKYTVLNKQIEQKETSDDLAIAGKSLDVILATTSRKIQDQCKVIKELEATFETLQRDEQCLIRAKGDLSVARDHAIAMTLSLEDIERKLTEKTS